MMAADVPNGAASRTLVRLLGVVLKDEEKRRRAIRDALRSAGRKELPADSGELLDFAKMHLAPQLIGKVPPNLLLAMIDDVAAEVEQPPIDIAPTGRWPLNATPKPPSFGSVPPTASPDPTPGPFPKLKRSVDNLVRVVNTGGGPAAMHANPSGDVTPDRPSTVLVESNRILRAGMARALLAAQFDVTVLDSSSDVRSALQSATEPMVAILDVATREAATTLRSLANTCPSLRVVAWTDASPTWTQNLLGAIGVRRFETVSRMATAVQLVDAVRLLLRNSQPSGTRF